MFAFIITVHVVVSVFLIFVILLQPGKGDAGMAAFTGGGGASSTVFGGRGSVTFLSKVTSVCAIVFMLTSLTLAYRSSHSDSVLRARRNIAAEDANKKKTDATPKPSLPTGATAPPQATGGAAVPVPGDAPGGPSAPAATAPARDSKGTPAKDSKPSAAPAAPKK